MYKANTKIRTDGAFRETARHGSGDYPFQYYLEDIWLFDLHCVDWHWHPEVELVYLESGSADFFVGSERYHLETGMGIFINSQVLHRFRAAESTVIPNIVFSPTLLSPHGSLLYEKYLRPVLDFTGDCIILSPEVPWQDRALLALRAVFAVQESERRELLTVQHLLRLWELLYEDAPRTSAPSQGKGAVRAQAQLQIMLQFIHTHYAQPVTLENIAQAVPISKSGTLSLFRQVLHISPVRYLVDYRLKQAARLLTSTNASISAVAGEVGFENPGYFCRQFKKLFGVTPGEYRRKEDIFERAKHE